MEGLSCNTNHTLTTITTNQPVSYFIQAVILCNPCTILWASVAFSLLLTMTRRNTQPIKAKGQFLWLKTSLALLLVFIQSRGTPRDEEGHAPNVTGTSQYYDLLMSVGSPAGSYILVMFLFILEMFELVSLSLPIFLFWLTTLASLMSTLYHDINSNDDDHDAPKELCHRHEYLWIDTARICVVIVQCFLSISTILKSKTENRSHSENTSVHPKSKASWLSDIFLHWTLDVIRTGAKRNLEETDIWDPLEADTCHSAFSTFERFWKIEKFKRDLDNEATNLTKKDIKTEKDTEMSEIQHTSRVGKDVVFLPARISLFSILIKAFGLKFFLLQFAKAIGELGFFVSPVLIATFMSHIQNRQNESWLNGLAIVVSTFLLNSLVVVFQSRISCSIRRYQMRIRGSMMLCVFKKSLTAKNECTNNLTTGEIVNLISDDCERIVNTGGMVCYIASTPIMISGSMYLLYSQVGKGVFVGLLIILLLIPVNKYVGEKIKKTHKEMNAKREKRIKLMNEIINGIKVLKLYAWEPSFIRQVEDIRHEEERYNNTLGVLEACIDSMFRAVPFLIKLAAFGSFIIIYGGHIDAAKGFVTLHLVHTLNYPFGLMPLLIPKYVEAAVALERINKFLNGEDIPHDVVTKRRKGQSAIAIDNGTFSWNRSSTKPNLKHINVDIPKGGLVAVVGMVGSGKSSLLSAILGEMENLHGDVEVQGRVAYVPQEAWVLNASLQDNVLFGSELETRRYQQVVSACALDRDISVMTAGDKTEIGEKGINLSGGQKQRVSLARAVYNDADVYLLDDPLSAVDAHVGKHIFNKVIGHRGVLKGKTRVLVTHGIHWLPFVDSIIVVKDGMILEAGSFKQLMSHEGGLAQLLRDTLSRKTEESSSTLTKVKQKIVHRLNSLNEDKQGEESKEDNIIHPDMNLSSGSDTMSDSSSDADSVGDEETESFKATDRSRRDDNKAGFVDDEDSEQGQVKRGIYLEYARAVGYKTIMAFVLIYLTTTVFYVVNTHVVQRWTDDPVLANESLSASKFYVEKNWRYVIVFAVTGVVEMTSAFLFIIVVLTGTFQAASRLHNTLLYRILRSPMSFFETTPSCRIICLFSKDVPRVDDLGGCLRRLIHLLLHMCIHLLLIIVYCPVISVYLIPISITYVFMFRLHIGALRQLRRYRSKHRSPMYAHFTETLNGRESIRAYNSQERFIKTMENRIDKFTTFEMWLTWVNVGMNLRLEMLCQLVALMANTVCMLDKTMSPGMVGMVTIYAGKFTAHLASLFRLLAHIETEIVSLERMVEYTNKPSEAEWALSDESPTMESPSDGHVNFENYKASYREGLDLVLKGITCQIQSGQKIGIVGRTGAGKTSLTMALFRLFEAADGKITVDGEKIADLGLHGLRTRINILPQDPVIFSGSIRMNLDPFGSGTDEDIWRALRQSYMATFVDGLSNKLDFECGEGGKNLSVGQRQLLCLARTLLRKTKILVLDEATAAVDMETDELIQKTIRTEFKEATVLTIAHRLNTIIDYDKILVLDQGLVKEFDSPHNLLADKDSMFYSMAKDANLVQS